MVICYSKVCNGLLIVVRDKNKTRLISKLEDMSNLTNNKAKTQDQSSRLRLGFSVVIVKILVVIRLLSSLLQRSWLGVISDWGYTFSRHNYLVTDKVRKGQSLMIPSYTIELRKLRDMYPTSELNAFWLKNFFSVALEQLIDSLEEIQCSASGGNIL
ncbi:hypothetical protein Lal_00038029 [Lupinus albus]|nr:hypothetical protein Lal_00038029 [Lupinus albus]